MSAVIFEYTHDFLYLGYTNQNRKLIPLISNHQPQLQNIGMLLECRKLELAAYFAFFIYVNNVELANHNKFNNQICCYLIYCQRAMVQPEFWKQ